MLTDNAWAGQPCYILGGGPSLKGFNFGKLAGQNVIAINAAALKFMDVDTCKHEPRATVVYVEDKRVLDVEIKGTCWFRVMSSTVWIDRANGGDGHSWEFIFHAVEPNLPDLTGWQVIPSTGAAWGTSLTGGLVHASNAGVSALNLACVLGADPIYGMGLDLKPREDGRTQHFHDYYPEAWRQPGHVYDRFIADFTRYAPDAQANGRRVVNLNPDSALTCFPKEAPPWV